MPHDSSLLLTVALADTGMASRLAGIGVILLMFGVGLRFSIKDLMAVRAIAIPGAAPARARQLAQGGSGQGLAAKAGRL